MLSFRAPHVALAAVAALGLGSALHVWADPDDTTPTSSEAPDPAETARALDLALADAMAAAEVTPAPISSDAEFFRRIHLDLTERLPEPDAVAAFLADANPHKRTHLITSLLDTPAAHRARAVRWARVLIGRRALIRDYPRRTPQPATDDDSMDNSMDGDMAGDMTGDMEPEDPYAAEPGEDPTPRFVRWLSDQVEQNRTWDQLVLDMLTAEGDERETPAVGFLLKRSVANKGSIPESLAGLTSRLFLGVQIQCAQCHDHPYTDWTQRDFYGYAAYFSRLRLKRDTLEVLPNGKKRKGPYYLVERNRGEVRLPAPPGEQGDVIQPQFLDGTEGPRGRGLARRDALAQAILAVDSPWFAKATVNRVWSFYFGRGLVDPVDDLEQPDAPLLPVLEQLAEQFRQANYDLRWLNETILRTQAYQRTSNGPAWGRAQAEEVFARASVRPLTAEQLFYAVLGASRAEDMDDPRQAARLERRKAGLLRNLLQTFEDDEMTEQLDSGTIPQALTLLNGDLTAQALRVYRTHPLYQRLDALELPEAVDYLYLSALSRYPTDAERARVLDHVADVPTRRNQRREAWADVLWALLNSAEFTHNH